MFPAIKSARRPLEQALPKQLVDFSSSILDLSHKNLTPDLLELLVDALATSAVVVSLNISHNPLLGDTGMKHVAALVASNSNIHTLNLANTGCTRWGLEMLCQSYSKHKAIRTLDLSSNIDMDDMAALELERLLSLPEAGFQSIRLLGTSISPTGAVSILQGVHKCHSLTSIVMPYHIGRIVQREIDATMAARRASDQRKKLEISNRRQQLYDGPAPLQKLDLSSSSFHSPRRTHETASLSEWSSHTNRGPLMCLALLEARTHLAIEARTEALNGAAEVASSTPRTRLGSYLTQTRKM